MKNLLNLIILFIFSIQGSFAGLIALDSDQSETSATHYIDGHKVIKRIDRYIERYQRTDNEKKEERIKRSFVKKITKALEIQQKQAKKTLSNEDRLLRVRQNLSNKSRTNLRAEKFKAYLEEISSPEYKEKLLGGLEESIKNHGFVETLEKTKDEILNPGRQVEYGSSFSADDFLLELLLLSPIIGLVLLFFIGPIIPIILISLGGGFILYVAGSFAASIGG